MTSTPSLNSTGAPDATALRRPRRSSSSRIAALDVLRGLALAGIMIVNLPAILHLDPMATGGTVSPLYMLEQDFVQNRFFPIFSFLFGIGFGMMWIRAETRSPRPRLALLRRFLFLAALGLGHQLLQPGEALLPYAIAATVVLLPTTWIPSRHQVWVSASLGALLTVVGVWFGGGLPIIPGLFLLGFASGLTDLVRRALARPVLLACLAAVAAGGTVAGYLTTDYIQRQTTQSITAGLGLGTAFVVCAVTLLLMRTPIRALAESTLAPLGRMALSNYLGATVLIVAAGALLPPLSDLDGRGGFLAGLIVCTAILVLQIIASSLWLRFVGQGPLERLWRIVTWGPANA